MNEQTKHEPKEKLVVVRVRGLTGIRKDIKDTLNMLRLYRRNYCVILPNTPSILGMLKKAKDYITWGKIDAETEKLLIEKRQEKTKNKEGKEIAKLFFRLNSPRKGYAKKNIKTPFTLGGALGDRKEKINDLIKRMV
jgi:large subunit ribosomal protein L30